eukprot:12257213-Alexandrium_andersonii.AAC.1
MATWLPADRADSLLLRAPPAAVPSSDLAMPMPNATSPCADRMSTAGSHRGAKASPAPASRAARMAARSRCPSLTLLAPPYGVTARAQPPP